MRVLGVDPGTLRMGYGVLEVTGPGTQCLAWGCLHAPRTQAIEGRLRDLHDALAEVITRWQPDQLAIEEPFVAPQRGAKAAVAVGQAQAVALLLAARAGMPVHRYAPSQVKRAVADYGAGTKEQVQRAVRLLLGLPAVPALAVGQDRPGAGTPGKPVVAMEDDASDALAVALCHLQQWRMTTRARDSSRAVPARDGVAARGWQEPA